MTYPYPIGADFAKYDGGGNLPYHVLNWDQYTWDFAYIKASEGTVIDPLFRQQWAAARGRAIRGPYHYFRPFVDPIVSVATFLAYLGGDPGELPPALDLETTDGQDDTVPRALAWLREYEKRTRIRPIIYSGPGFLDAIDAELWPQLAEYNLWQATYPFDNMAVDARSKRIHEILTGAYTFTFPPIPRPFKRRPFLQWTAKGNPADVPGYYMGTGHKLAVDFIFYCNGGVPQMRNEFAVSMETPTEPPTGERMEGKISKLTNMRTSPNQFSADLGDFLAGDSLTHSTQVRGSDGLDWVFVTNATRSGQPVKRTDGKTVAEAPVYAYAENIVPISTPPAPPAEDKPKTVTIEMESGRVFVADQFTEQ